MCVWDPQVAHKSGGQAYAICSELKGFAIDTTPGKVPVVEHSPPTSSSIEMPATFLLIASWADDVDAVASTLVL